MKLNYLASARAHFCLTRALAFRHAAKIAGLFSEPQTQKMMRQCMRRDAKDAVSYAKQESANWAKA